MNIEADMLKAHKENNLKQLVELYHKAAMLEKHEDAEAFFLTHAYVFALESNNAKTTEICNRLISLGRESK